MTFTTGARQLVVQEAFPRVTLCFAAFVLVFVDAEHHGKVLVRGRSGDDDLLDGCHVEVGLGLGRVGEEAGRFNDDFGAD